MQRWARRLVWLAVLTVVTAVIARWWSTRSVPAPSGAPAWPPFDPPAPARRPVIVPQVSDAPLLAVTGVDDHGLFQIQRSRPDSRSSVGDQGDAFTGSAGRVGGDVDHISVVGGAVGRRQQEATFNHRVAGKVDSQSRAQGAAIQKPGLHQPLTTALKRPIGADTGQVHDDAAVARTIGDDLSGGRTVEIDDDAGFGLVAAQADLQHTAARGFRLPHRRKRQAADTSGERREGALPEPIEGEAYFCEHNAQPNALFDLPSLP